MIKVSFTLKKVEEKRNVLDLKISLKDLLFHPSIWRYGRSKSSFGTWGKIDQW